MHSFKKRMSFPNHLAFCSADKRRGQGGRLISYFSKCRSGNSKSVRNN